MLAVQIFGLEGSPQYNGLTGVVVAFNAGSGRNRVRLADDKELAIKAENLMVAPNTSVAQAFALQGADVAITCWTPDDLPRASAVGACALDRNPQTAHKPRLPQIE